MLIEMRLLEFSWPLSTGKSQLNSCGNHNHHLNANPKFHPWNNYPRLLAVTSVHDPSLTGLVR